MALKQKQKNPILCFGNLVQVLGEARPTRSEIETSTEQILQPRIRRTSGRRLEAAGRKAESADRETRRGIDRSPTDRFAAAVPSRHRV
jgi:hypothetical protein